MQLIFRRPDIILFNKIETNIFYQLPNIKILDLYLGQNHLISQT